MIELRSVTKTFGTFTAVDNLSITIPPGELFGFLGPNGAGKTTTIKMIAGLFAPTSGTVIVNGFNIVTHPIDAKRTLAYVPDQPFLYDKLTGREFLYFVGGLYKMQKDLVHRRVAEVIEHFEIGRWVDKKAEDYSQGMRQRISIAAALVHQPKTIIVDEPMIGLDPRSSKIVRETLRQQAKAGVSILMSTHSLPVAEELCDRIGIIHNGRLVYCDTKDGMRAFEASMDGKLESVFLEITK
ncbi:MAG: ABC transporter [Ignavibacteria bacterium GWA2_55_11]|nr:MAG: ABC transporter [Ignavibacteria bacterium GWA2_55_11]OGU45955.1 MAG: ABC transporter [Ignavibacteria bacterium GWC2_56_12]OGU64134.1 MAG: ABC transporter [Ignavibacteria bacterium RIFCSPHIGHO2_02_FULL_56_12]OGU70242.1 MAG: ABC transporter [Ignavibacteria bacterium RIFCSPLOWO2_12_FULL_56_21]OGU74190.1 MAG: ABC transporter [Ignavibacteria bacterium RIFCSPLOWO2_02_FULL_55_14]HAV22076.1 ABC transporter [Bacteroidota bacterium]